MSEGVSGHSEEVEDEPHVAVEASQGGGDAGVAVVEDDADGEAPQSAKNASSSRTSALHSPAKNGGGITVLIRQGLSVHGELVLFPPRERNTQSAAKSATRRRTSKTKS